MLIEIKAAEREAAAEALQVLFLGEVFTVAEGVSLYPILRAMGSEADNDAAIMSAYFQMLRALFITADFERFDKMCMEKRVTMEQLNALIEGVTEALTARPTQRPSASPGGPPPTTAASRVVSLSQGTPSRSA